MQPDLETAAVRSAAVTQIDEAITVDGVLNETVWQTTPTIGALVQREPRPGEAPSERTDVRLLHDKDHLYIGVMAYDSEPGRIVSTEMTRDAALRWEDRVEVLLDTFGDQQSAFYFATNPAGVFVDGLVFANGQSNLEWDGIWTVRTSRIDQGWSAEFAIPFKSLSFPSDKTEWRFNFSRTIQRKLEEARWSGARLQTQFFQVSEAGIIQQLDGLSQGFGLNVRPFMAGRLVHTADLRHDKVTGKPGLDMFYNLTPSLKLTGTVNTDFGETEVDARQINLTRFSVFFPEKRSFFLEDAGAFSFSNTAVTAPPYLSPARAQVIPFFSRRVGLLAGEEVPIEFGVKLSGKVGRTDVGLLNVRTGQTGSLPDKNHFVARVRRNVLRQSHLGAIFTHGDPARLTPSPTFGVDVGLATSNLLGRGKNLAFNAYGLRSVREAPLVSGLSYGASLEYPNDLVELELAWRSVEKEFDPALGFVSRSNVRMLRVGGRWNPRPQRFPAIQQMFHGAYYNRFTRLDNGQVESSNLFIILPIDWHFKSGDALHALMSPDITYERLFAPFEISRGVILPPGEYRFTRWTNNVASAGRRRLQASFKWTLGDYWSGQGDEVQLTAAYKWPPHLSANVSAIQTHARLAEGSFTATVLSAQVNYAVSPLLAVSNLIQYDNQSNNLSWQSRLRWTIRPGSDFFFVVNQGWIQEDPADRRLRFKAQDNQVSTKVQYTFRL
jgi:hypothetical protein